MCSSTSTSTSKPSTKSNISTQLQSSSGIMLIGAGENRHNDGFDFVSKMERVLDILHSAEEIFSSSDDDLCIEPTPIGPDGVQVQVHYHDDIVSSIVKHHGGNTENYQLSDLSNLFNTIREDEHKNEPSFRNSKRAISWEQSTHRLQPSNKRQCLYVPTDSIKPTAPAPATATNKFRHNQCEQWGKRFQDLVDFKATHGNGTSCLVPHDFPENPRLSQWVKRQRYQFKLKIAGKHSTLTDIRQDYLQELGFAWDSHRAVWTEKFQTLQEYKVEHGDCNVPSNYSNQSMAVWVKCQRRQRKLSKLGKKSTISQERFRLLSSLGFDWNPRNLLELNC